MSFDENGGNCVAEVSIGKMRDCKPDYEAQAASIKKKLDSTTALENALFDFSDKNGTYSFRSISSFAEMVGGVTLVKREQTRGYEELLKRIEEET